MTTAFDYNVEQAVMEPGDEVGLTGDTANSPLHSAIRSGSDHEGDAVQFFDCDVAQTKPSSRQRAYMPHWRPVQPGPARKRFRGKRGLI